MRDYANIDNLKRASAWGIVIALMSIPRIMEAGMQIGTYVPAAFLGMTLVSAAATAWGDKHGLKGILPAREILAKGLFAATAAGLVALPLKVYITDPILKHQLSGRLLNLSFPVSAFGVFSVILWASGFENMFFNVAATSYFTRLFRNKWLAVAFSASFRAFVSSRVMLNAGVESPDLLILSAASCFVACTLFATGGLPAAMLFTAITASSIAFS